MSKYKRILGITLAGVMLIGAAACGKKDGDKGGSVAKKEFDKNCIYSYEDIDISGEGSNLYGIKECEDSIVALFTQTIYGESEMEPAYDENGPIVFASEGEDLGVAEGSDVDVTEGADADETKDADTDETKGADVADGEDADATEGEEVENVDDGSFTMNFVMLDMNGNKINSIEKEYATSNVNVSGFWMDKDQNIYYVLENYAKPDENRDTYELIKCDKNGNESWKTVLGENFDADEWYYARLSHIDGDNVYITSVRGVDIFNAQDGTLIKDYESEEIGSGSGVIGTLRDGTAYTTVYNGPEESNVISIDMNTMKSKGKLEVPFEIGMMDFYAGKTSDFVLTDSRGVYVCNAGDSAITKIMDFVDSDFQSTYLNSVIQVSDEAFMASWYDDINFVDRFGLFTKVKPEDVPDKETLVVGMTYLDYSVRQNVVNFNKNNSQYRVLLKDYSDQNGEMVDYDAMLEQMNNDIIGGNMPDILLIDEGLPLDSYIAKGLCEDLYTFIDKDSTYNRDYFAPNVLRAMETDGKLYQMMPSFYVSTVVAKKDVVGDRTSISMDDLMSIMSTQSPEVMDFGKLTKSEFMYQAMRYNMEKFVNWETGKVTFDSDEFIKILEYTDKYPLEFDMDDESFWDGYESMYAEGRALFSIESINDFSRFISLKQGSFGNSEVSYVGFPNESGNGNFLNSYMTFAINSKSPNKEAAWEFLTTFLTEEAQDEVGSFPVAQSALDRRLEKAKKLPTYTDDNGEEVEYHEKYWMYDTEIELNPLTDAEAKEVYDFVMSIDEMCTVDRNIADIVDEECASYYNKQKSAKEVAKIIESRVQIYVNESR